MADAMRVYIAGPIAGHPDYEERFAEAVALLEGRGYEPVNPLDVEPVSHEGPCPPYGYHPTGDEAWEGPHQSSCCFMRTDIVALLSCDYIYLLDGWEKSRGASVEASVARAVGIPLVLLTPGGVFDGAMECPSPPGVCAHD